MKDKLKINFIIDILMFICMMGIVSLGLLLKFILIPGKERWIKYGKNIDLFWLGMDRHEWGDIHLIIGFVLIGLLFLHIVLHWKMILTMYQRLVSNQKKRKIFFIVFITICIFLIIFPFIINPEIKESSKKSLGYKHEIESFNNKDFDYFEIDIKGYMTLREVSQRYNVPIEFLKRKLGLEDEISDDSKLSWLKNKYNFKMSDVKKVINNFYNNKINH